MRRICLLGFGKSNRAFYNVMKSIDPELVFFVSEKSKIPDDLKEMLSRNNDLWEENHTNRILDCDLIIRSPGVNPNMEILQKALKEGIRVETEVEFTYRFLKNKGTLPTLIGVTGTNGKTTTVEMVEMVMNEAGYSIFTGANIGKPFCEILRFDGIYDFAILELSSFQLADIEELHLDVAVITNIEEDHIDWHGNFEGYIRAKLRILENQNESDLAVLNVDCEFLRNVKTTGELVSFSMKPESRIHVDKLDLVVDGRRFSIPKNIKGKHNLYNLMASIGATMRFVEPSDALRYLERFKTSEHRLEEFFDYNGVIFVNDSKSTNGSSTVSAVEYYKGRRICLILQGRPKGENYAKMVKRIKDMVSFIFTMGEISEVVAPILEIHGLKYERVGDLDELMESLKKRIDEFDVVLFSPSASSFDIFENYEDRGKKFKEKVLEWFKGEE